jgi:hypothetical protein
VRTVGVKFYVRNRVARKTCNIEFQKKKFVTINPQNTGDRLLNIKFGTEPYTLSIYTIDTAHWYSLRHIRRFWHWT